MSRLRLFVGGALFLGFLGVAIWFFLDDPISRRARPRIQRAPASSAAVDPGAAPNPEPAPAAATPSATPALRTRTLSGQVTDTDGAALAQAKVALRVDGKTRTARTDAQGRYRFDAVPRITGRLEASATGHEPEKARVAADARAVDLALTRRPGLVVQVRHAGQPVATAYVMAYATEGLRPLSGQRTDDGGLAWFAWPERGIGRVVVRHEAHGFTNADVSGPGRVEVDLPGGGYLTGRVTDARGGAVGAFSISANGRVLHRLPTQSFESADGSFRYGPVAPGRLTVHAAAQGHQPGKRSVVVRSGETTDGVDFRLEASVRLVGRVFDSKTGDPIEGARIIPAEWRAGVLAESVGTYSDDSGRYTLESLPGKRSSIRVKADGYRSVLIGGVEGPPGGEVQRDFGLTPQPRDQVPATELTGIGAVLGRHRKGVRIGRVFGEGPASEVLSSGDVIVAIDGEPVGRRGINGAAQAIRGEEGTDVELMVLRGGEGDPVPVVITRGRVTVPDRHHRRN